MERGHQYGRILTRPAMIVVVLLLRSSVHAQHRADARSHVANTLSAADGLAVPAQRRSVVDALRARQRAMKQDAVARAALRGLPTRVEAPDGQGVRELMRWDANGPFYYATFNANAAISTGADLLRAAPYFATGLGGVVGVWDAGSVRATHQEFGGRVTVMDGAAAHNHSTHVGGTIAATGVVATAIGMARDVRLDSYDWNDDLSELASRGATYGGESNKLYVSNHSYGGVGGWYGTGVSSPAWIWYGTGTTAVAYDDDFGRYGPDALNTDALAAEMPYFLMFWAAGNDRSNTPSPGSSVALSEGGSPVAYNAALHPPGDGVYRSGYDTLSYMALAKNVLTVGAVGDAVTGAVRNVSNATMTAFSSWGPADDGRIKPDLVANGLALNSTRAGADNAYGSSSGTSMASPNAAGTAQQVAGYHTSLFPGQYLRASTLKGLLIHTADDLGVAGPDYQFGWGLVNGKAAADLLKASQTNRAPRRVEQQLTPAESVKAHVFTWNGVSPIRVTLCWTDPAGTYATAHDSRAASLVNDLNLQIVGPTGTTHLPFVMPFVGTWTTNLLSAAAATGTNHTDNVEQVLIAFPPAAGVYQAIVSHSGTLADGEPQSYSLLLSGSAPPPPTLLLVR